MKNLLARMPSQAYMRFMFSMFAGMSYTKAALVFGMLAARIMADLHQYLLDKEGERHDGAKKTDETSPD